MSERPAARSILVIHVSRIGDTLLATPALRAIAAAWPEAELTCLGHRKRIEVLCNLPFVHHLGAISKGRARVLRWCATRRHDLAFVFGHDEALVRYALRVAERVIAFRQANEALNRRLYRIAERPGFQDRHAVDYLLALLAPLAIPAQGRYLSYRVSEEESAWARSELRALRGSGATPLVGLQIASFPTKAYRDWPLSHFVDLCDRLLARYPAAHFLILGGAEESGRTKTLGERLAGRASLYAGSLSLRASAALMNELDLYIGVDTGPTHIMGALRRPMVALYHGYSPSTLLAPLEHPSLYAVDHPSVENPNAGARCGPQTPMAEISVDRVAARALEALRCHYARGAR